MMSTKTVSYEVPDIKTLAEAEKAHILAAMDICNGNRMRTARALDIGLSTLQRKLKEYGVPPGKAGGQRK